MAWSRRTSVLALAAAAVVLLGGAALSFAPLVREAASRRAARHGATVSIQHVRPTWSGVRLEGVRARLLDAPHVAIDLGVVEVDGGRVGPVERVTVRGGVLTLVGEPDALAAEARAVLARAPASPAGPARAIPVHLSGLSLRWERGPGGDAVTGTGVSLHREGPSVVASAESAIVSVYGARVAASGLRVELARGSDAWQLHSVETSTLEADVTLPSGSSDGALTDASAADGSLGGRVARWRTRAGEVALAVAHTVGEDAKIRVGEASVVVHRGAEVLHAGPGELRVAVRREAVAVSLTPTRAGAGASPLQLTADVPLDASREVALTVHGGPITLAALGFREGDMGLLEVAKATVEAGGNVTLSGDARHVELGLQGKVRGLSLRHPKLSAQAIQGLDVGFSLTGGADLDGARVRIDRGDLNIGTVHAEVAGELERATDGFRLQGKAAVPLASCQGLLDALPAGLAPKLVGMKMSGTFALESKIAFDSRRADASAVNLSLLDECRVTHAPPELDVARFRSPHRRLVYAPDGARVEVDAGPGTGGWVPFFAISPFMEAAVLTTEDGRFRGHRGFDLEALRNSIRENLKAGKFVRGGSTISMQTAKNVYLERDKTLARKLEEAVLTSYLEQVLSKEQILELYLNSIEFGPMIYGIGPAAAHYFHTTAADLSLGQALYLSSILPNPKAQHFAEGGRVSAGWMGYLHKLMRMMAKRHLISDAEAADGQTEWVVFGVPRPPRVRLEGDAARGAEDLSVDREER